MSIGESNMAGQFGQKCLTAGKNSTKGPVELVRSASLLKLNRTLLLYRESVNVFTCGPDTLNDEIQKTCRKFNNFQLTYESF